MRCVNMQMQLYSEWWHHLRLLLECVLCIWLLGCICQGYWKIRQRSLGRLEDANMPGIIVNLVANTCALAAILFWWIHTLIVHNSSICTTCSDDDDLLWHVERVQFSSISRQGIQQAAENMAKVCLATLNLQTDSKVVNPQT